MLSAGAPLRVFMLYFRELCERSGSVVLAVLCAAHKQHSIREVQGEY